MAPDVVDAYFVDQELYDEFSLKCLELDHDNTLTSEEKQNEQRDLEKILPEKFRNRRKRETEIKNLYFNKGGSSPRLTFIDKVRVKRKFDSL